MIRDTEAIIDDRDTTLSCDAFTADQRMHDARSPFASIIGRQLRPAFTRRRLLYPLVLTP